MLHRTMQETMKNMACELNRKLAPPIALALLSSLLGLGLLTEGALAKTPGRTYCTNGVCHRVKTVEEVQAEVGREETVGASFYDDCKVDPGNPCTLLSSGEELHADRPDNAASPVYPDGTMLALLNPKNDRIARVRINNSGPYIEGRMLDVSRATAEQLGFLESGVAQLKVIVVSGPTKEEQLAADNENETTTSASTIAR
jgi:rare lipoprotein A